MIVAITQIGSAFITGGINTFIFELSNALLQGGHKVYLISGREKSERYRVLKEMFDVEKLPKVVTLMESSKAIYSPKLNTETIKELAVWMTKGSSLIREIAPDIVIVNGAVPLLTQTLKVVVCHDLEFRERPGLTKIYDRILYRTFNIVAAASSELAQAVRSELGLKEDKVITIPICIDTNKYFALPYEKRDHAILHVGAWADKNLEATIKIFCKIVRKDPTLKLYVVGELWERPMKILSKVRPEFLKNINLLGKISKAELRDLYSKVKVTSIPSTYRIPVCSPTALESLASGTPVVGSLKAISKDLLIDGYNGYRVHPMDLETFSEKIRLLTIDRELWEIMSANALRTAKNFDASKVAKKYIWLIKSVGLR